VAHITEFSVTGLAGRREPYSQVLDRHVNVFFGLNGSGKTSLLKILHAAMSNEVSSLRTVPFTAAQVKIYSIDHKKIYICNYTKPQEEKAQEQTDELVTLNTNRYWITGARSAYSFEAIDAAWQVEPQESELAKTSGWNHRYLPISRLYMSEAIPISTMETLGRQSGLTEDFLEESFSQIVNRLWSSYSAEVLGIVQRVQAHGLAEILKAIVTGHPSSKATMQVDLPVIYERVSKFLERQGSRGILGDTGAFEQRYQSNSQFRSAVTDINSVELQIQDAMAPRNKLESLIGRMFTGNKRVTFKDSSIEIMGTDNQKIGLGRLSSGEKQLIRIFIDAISVGESSLILDEPEISMHVDWQRSLINAMRELNPGMQIITATHSPEVMAEISDKNIYRL
jgi:predicted ATPase